MGYESNVGETGLESIRISGRRIQDLPMAPSAHAKQGLPAAIAGDRQSKIDGILARYPKASVAYLEGAIRECKDNIRRVQVTKQECKASIKEYHGLLAACAGKPSLRDLGQEIHAISQQDLPLEARMTLIHDLKATAAPYDVAALTTQVAQFEESIERCDAVVQQEHESIAECSEALGQCRMRDQELKSLGEGPAG